MGGWRQVYGEEGEGRTRYQRRSRDEGGCVDRAVNPRAAAVAASIDCLLVAEKWKWNAACGSCYRAEVTCGLDTVVQINGLPCVPSKRLFMQFYIFCNSDSQKKKCFAILYLTLTFMSKK
jgi:hypothetical protein